MKEYKLCTIREFAEYCADIIVNRKGYSHSSCFDAPLPDCDFAIVDDLGNEMTLEEVAASASGWCGLKKLDAGFDSMDMCLVSDYYGGGCMNIATFCGDESMAEVTQAIYQMVYDTLTTVESVHKSTLLIIEINNYFEAVEVCPHCDSENIYPMWDTAKLGYVANCQCCGKQIMLCDECFHSEDNGLQKCDWCVTECGGKCFRGITVNKKEG